MSRRYPLALQRRKGRLASASARSSLRPGRARRTVESECRVRGSGAPDGRAGRRFGANVQPGQIVAVGSEPGKESLDPRDRRERLPPRRALRGRHLLRPVRQARAAAARAGGHARVRAAVVRRADARARRPALRADRAHRPGGARPARRPRPRARRPRPAAVRCTRPAQVVNDRTTNWTIVPCPTAGLGGARPSRTSSRMRRSSGCGSSSRTSAGSTRTTRSPPGASASTRSRPPPSGSPSGASTRCTSTGPAPT